MKTKRARIVVLVGAMVLATVLGTNRPAHAAPPPTAVAVAISPARGHLFAVSEILGKSWVSMLDAQTGKALHAVTVPTGTSQILVDDRSGHAFLCSRDATVMLSTRSGRILAQLTWTSGNADMQALAGRLGFLYVTAGSRLHQIDTRTGRELQSVPLSSQPFASVAVQEGTGRVFTLDGAGMLRIYDASTLHLVQEITVQDPPPAFTLPLAPVLTAAENENTVLLISGQARQNLMVLDAATGAELRTVPVPPAIAVALDAKTSHAFIVSAGNAGEPPYTNGAITTIDTTTGTVLRTVQVGAEPGRLAVDPATDHLFVLSLPPVSNQDAIDFWSAEVSMIDTQTGTLLRTTTIPQTVLAASGLAVDSAHHRVYVSWATSQGNSLTVLDSRTNALLPRLFLASEGGAAPWWRPVWRSTVRITADGRFLYGSNRGHDSIAIWAIDATSGEVTPVGHESTRGQTPRNFGIDSTGVWLLAANQDSDTIVTFRRDRETGTLTATGPVAEIPSPVAIVFSTV